MLVSFPSPHTTSRAKSQQPWLSTADSYWPPALSLRACHGQFYSRAARVKMSTHILVIVNPLVKLLRRRKQWERRWLWADWAPLEMGHEILARHWPWVIGSLSCVPERTTGNHRFWFRSCGDNLSRGCMTVVVQLFSNGCLPVSPGLCFSWPVARGKLPGSVNATQGDTCTSWVFTPFSD